MNTPSLSIRVSGFRLKHRFKDAYGKECSFAEHYKYYMMPCPRCKEKKEMLYPALNKCPCGCVILFGVLNDGENRIGTFDLEKLKEVLA